MFHIGGPQRDDWLPETVKLHVHLLADRTQERARALVEASRRLADEALWLTDDPNIDEVGTVIRALAWWKQHPEDCTVEPDLPQPTPPILGPSAPHGPWPWTVDAGVMWYAQMLLNEVPGAHWGTEDVPRSYTHYNLPIILTPDGRYGANPLHSFIGGVRQYLDWRPLDDLAASYRRHVERVRNSPEPRTSDPMRRVTVGPGPDGGLEVVLDDDYRAEFADDLTIFDRFEPLLETINGVTKATRTDGEVWHLEVTTATSEHVLDWLRRRLDAHAGTTS